MDNNPPSSGSGLAANAQQPASFINPVTSMRDMKCITVSKSELHTLSVYNGLCSLFVGLSTACISLAIGIYTSFANYDPVAMTADSKALCHLGEPLGFALGVIFAVAAIVSQVFGHNHLKLIEGEMRKP